MADIGNEHQSASSHRDVVEKLWTAPVYEACVTEISVPSASSLLVAEARCGHIPERILSLIPEDTRVIALDPSRAMLDLARQRMDESAQRRVFFVPQRVGALSYADDVFKASICLNGVVTAREAEEALKELARVTCPGGQIIFGVPLNTCFPEFFDILDEALRAHQLHDVLGRMYDMQESLLTPGLLSEIAESAGLHDTVFQELSWDVSFASGQELLMSPLIRETFYPHWMGVIRSSDRDAILRYIADAVDTYWHDDEFTCHVVAGCLRAIC